MSMSGRVLSRPGMTRRYAENLTFVQPYILLSPGVSQRLLLPHCCHLLGQLLSMSKLLTLGEVLTVAENLR